MAEGLNSVSLIGNLGDDPELRYTQSGTAVLNIRIATTESYVDSDRNRKERTDWHNVVVWGKRAEGLSKILSKGSKIFVEGSLRTSSYEARDGSGKRYKTEVNVRKVLLLGDKRQQGNDNQQSQGRPQQGRPQQGRPQQGRPQQGRPQQGRPQQGRPQENPDPTRDTRTDHGATPGQSSTSGAPVTGQDFVEDDDDIPF